jgi:hypothetical protein
VFVDDDGELESGVVGSEVGVVVVVDDVLLVVGVGVDVSELTAVPT